MARHPASLMASPPKEIEVKLGAGPAFHLPSLDGVVDGAVVQSPEVLRLETVYHDTPDLRLARWGVSLRHRGGEGWTLKLSPRPGTASNPGVLQRTELNYSGGPTRRWRWFARTCGGRSSCRSLGCPRCGGACG